MLAAAVPSSAEKVKEGPLVTGEIVKDYLFKPLPLLKDERIAARTKEQNQTLSSAKEGLVKRPDVKDTGDIETLAGLEYESCCWKARLVHRRFKINDDSYEKNIQFQIMLKGFTDVGTPLGNVISDSIRGYVDREY